MRHALMRAQLAHPPMTPAPSAIQRPPRAAPSNRAGCPPPLVPPNSHTSLQGLATWLAWCAAAVPLAAPAAHSLTHPDCASPVRCRTYGAPPAVLLPAACLPVCLHACLPAAQCCERRLSRLQHSVLAVSCEHQIKAGVGWRGVGCGGGRRAASRRGSGKGSSFQTLPFTSPRCSTACPLLFFRRQGKHPPKQDRVI